MRGRDLERLLIANGAGAAKVDAITRRLRHCGRLAKGGRGINAPDIGAPEAAAILLALAGSTKGAEADLRLEKLEGLPCSKGSNAPKLLPAFTAMLQDPGSLASLSELRVARTRRRATFVYEDGTTTQYERPSEATSAERFLVEGVLPGPLLKLVAVEIRKSAGLHGRTLEAVR